MRKLAASALGLILAATTASGAVAQDEWDFRVTPYLWLAFPSGDVTARSARSGGGGGFDSDVSVTFDDVELSGAFTGSAEVRYGAFGAMADLTYYEVEGDKDITIGPLPALDGKVTVSGTKGMIVGFWRAYETDTSSVDLLGGAHFLGVETEVNVTGPVRSITGKVEEDLWDPVIGVRGATRFGDHFGVYGLATAGGFGVSSDSLYELQGYLTYKFNDTFTALAGYRYYQTKFEGDRLIYDASFSGPLIGLSFNF